MNTFRHYLPLCWFGENPLDLPRSVKFFKQNLWFYFFLELFIQVNMIEDFEALFEVTLETILTLLFTGIILLLNRSSHSYIQVTSAILFCENIVALFGLPVMVWLTITDHELSYIAMALLIFWDFSLVAFIVKKVLGINTAASFVMSLFYFFSTYGGAYGITLLILG